MFPELNFPKYSFRMQKQDSGYKIWGACRKKWLICTPEEWVRQHVIFYLNKDLGYPLGRIASELTINQNGMKKRCDLVVYDELGQPQMIVECKESRVALDEKTLFQIARYNSVLKVPLLVMTNGIQTITCLVDDQVNYLKEIPKYGVLIN